MRAADRLSRAGILVASVVAAVLVNTVLYALGAAAGGSYDFTSTGRPAHVDVATLAGFTSIPLAAGLIIVAVLPRRWRWVDPTAIAVALLLAVGSIPAMPLAADLDTASATALTLCHLAVGAVAVLGIRALRIRSAAVTRRASVPNPAQ